MSLEGSDAWMMYPLPLPAGEVKSCFLSPGNVRYEDHASFLQYLRLETAQRSAQERAEARLRNCKRLRRAEAEMEEMEDIDTEALKAQKKGPAAETEEAAEAAAQIVPEAAEAAEAAEAEGSAWRVEARQIPTVSALDLSQLSKADHEWLTNHPLYIKIRRGYPIPIGDHEILALKNFTPKEASPSEQRPKNVNSLIQVETSLVVPLDGVSQKHTGVI